MTNVERYIGAPTQPETVRMGREERMRSVSSVSVIRCAAMAGLPQHLTGREVQQSDPAARVEPA
jgi:hypothetical protein